MYSIITIPSNFAASTTAVSSELFTDLTPIIVLILGVVLVAVVVEIILSAIRK